MSDPVDAAIADGRTVLTEAESKAVLESVGIDTPEFEVADSSAAAVEAADRIGYPVVAKVSSPAVLHKSDWADGVGVAVGLSDAQEVTDAAEQIFTAAEAANIDVGVLVEGAADLDSGTEVIVGGISDPSFGPVTLVGLGGVFTELFEDTAHRLAPVSERDARDAIESLTAAPLLSGYRGHPAGDIDDLVDLLRTVGELLVENESIAEIDVNPVLVTPEGATALDALIVLEE